MSDYFQKKFNPLYLSRHLRGGGVALVHSGTTNCASVDVGKTLLTDPTPQKQKLWTTF